MNTPLLDIKNISLKIHGNAILSDINYQVNSGDFIIILGSNGSGKSSLLKLLEKQYQPTKGNIFLDDKSLNSYSSYELSQNIITLTQNPHESLFCSLTVLENYLLSKQRHEPQIFGLAKKSDRQFFSKYLLEFNVNLAKKLDQVVEKLSGGEKQALALALSVLYPPKILLLDEHTSALDPKSEKQLMSLTQRIVSEHHITCILTTHNLEIAMEYGNRILALRHGEIYKTIDNKKKEFSRQDLLAMCY